MNRLPILAASLAATLTLVVGASDARAQAAVPGAYYVAVPETPAGKASVMTRSTPWALRGDAYVAARAPEREMVLCQTLARSVGRLRSFSAGGTALDGAALEKCNARAKAMPATAMAAR
ncbi:MAG TPA: hypothetical protein VF592_01905 [Sphingomonas sp.]|jgi:hypothetical protein|uniref:CC_3452 family protein n=1 Tax=Sphingomonas sp. TaxID=28214 RepID=UPI002ED96FE8